MEAKFHNYHIRHADTTTASSLAGNIDCVAAEIRALRSDFAQFVNGQHRALDERANIERRAFVRAATGLACCALITLVVFPLAVMWYTGFSDTHHH